MVSPQPLSEPDGFRSPMSGSHPSPLPPAGRQERPQAARPVGLVVVLILLGPVPVVVVLVLPRPILVVVVGLVLLFLVLVIEVATEGARACANQGALAGVAAEGA